MDSLAYQKAMVIYEFMNKLHGFGISRYYNSDGALNFSFVAEKLNCFGEKHYTDCRITPTVDDSYSMKIYKVIRYEPYEIRIIKEVNNVKGNELYPLFNKVAV